MHSTHRPSMKSSALKKLTAAVASALVLSSAVHAAGLGKLTVLSALGQPLRAEIELTAVSSDEASGLVAKLASPDAFRTANIEFNPALLSLRFAVEQRNGRQFIRVSSTQPLNEPFVDMLLELSWNNGRLVREYTFLLDPAELRATQSAQVASNEAPPAARPRAEAPAAAAAPAAPVASERPRRGDRARAEEGAQAANGAAPGRASAGAGSKYRVKPGDSLGRIAAQLKPVDVSLDMMLVALYRANPDAFIGNNMNRLKSGRILSVPDAGGMQSLNEGEAHGVVVAHAADFNAYRNKLAGQVGAAEPVKTPSAGQSAGGKITAKVEERPTAANESQDQLRLSKAPAAGAAAGKGSTMSTEDTIAKQRELEEAQKRVKELEQNVNDLEKIATVKSKGGAEAQQNAASTTAPAPAATQDKPAQKKLAAIKPAAKPASPVAEPGLLDFLMDNLPLVGGGAAVLLLGGLLAAQRRKKKEVKAVPEPSILGVPTEPAHSLFAETGGQSVDTNNSVFNSSFAPSASQLDTNEVDPVAEADVYIAYGRDAQAEEILKEALRTHPERYPVRLKLLEIYAARKDQRAFETQAGELYSMTRGQGDEWAQAAALGLSIDPLNPLYAAGSPQPDAVPAPGEAAPTLSAQDFDDAFDADRTAVPTAAAAAAGAVAAHEAMSFDQHFAGAMNAAQPAIQPEAAAVPAEDEHTLDFDLGGLAFEPVQAEESKPAQAAHDDNLLDFDMGGFDAAPAEPVAAHAETAAAPAAAEEPLDFSFDMDFGAPAANPVPQPAVRPFETVDDLTFGDFDLGDTIPGAGAAQEIAAAPAPAAEFANSDFDMANLAREFDLPAIPAAPEETSPATELKDPLFDLDTMDFGLADEVKPVQAESFAPAADPAPALSLEDELFGLQDLPNALPVATPAPVETADYAPHDMLEPAKVEPAFALGGFDLDLPGESNALPDFETVAAPADAPVELTAGHMEMETKLDLAIAYQEIGDKEGARELLEEVIKGGNSEQVSKATAMRAQLA
ncbi:FimV/HubP family polar landmark protein [Massilia aerilata]|uniref:FimV/HubP family polar landmark protein n=1 Tax=Massilia aerilata TaxID=453817 RepID=A0ABW0RU32_9BURK